MKLFNWSSEKNQHLVAERGISFKEVIDSIQQGQLLDDIAHPNSAKYPNQKIFVVYIRNYVYLVPYVEDEKEIFLKTIIPSRKFTKLYLKGALL